MYYKCCHWTFREKIEKPPSVSDPMTALIQPAHNSASASLLKKDQTTPPARTGALTLSGRSLPGTLRRSSHRGPVYLAPKSAQRDPHCCRHAGCRADRRRRWLLSVPAKVIDGAGVTWVNSELPAMAPPSVLAIATLPAGSSPIVVAFQTKSKVESLASGTRFSCFRSA
jgi:hypothetical protein